MQQAPSNSLVINSSGNVLLGTTVEGRAAEGADRFTIADATHSGMTIRSGTGSYGSINFSDSEGGTGEYAGSIFFAHGGLGDKLVLATAGIDRVTISSNSVGIGTQSPASPLGANYSSLDLNSGVWGGTVNFSGNSGGYIGNRHSGNTGLGYYSAVAHSFAVNGSTAASLTITSDGDVGIGATNPGGSRLYLQDTHTTAVTNATQLIANTTLTINGNSSQGSDVIRMGPMGTAGRYFIDVSNSAGSAAYDLLLNPIGSGNVGIGTTSAGQTLVVQNNTSSSYGATGYNGNATLTLKTPNAVTNYSGIRYTNTSGNYEWYAGSNQVGSNSADFVFQGYDRGAGGYKEMMRIEDSGYVTTPQIPAFSYLGSKSHSITTTGTQTMSSSNVWSASVNHAFNNGSHFNASNGRFTAPIAGKYYFQFQCMASNFGSGYLWFYMNINSTTKSYMQMNQQTNRVPMVHHMYCDLSANDYVTCQWTNNYVSGQIHYPGFSGHLIG